MATGEHRYTKTGSSKKPANDLMCGMKFPQMIVTSFEKWGITNTLDNSDNSVEGGEEERGEEHIVVTLEDISGNKND